jgi:LAO/AO transport system kinase
LNPEIKTWVERLRVGDPRSLARAISTVENHAPGWLDLLKALFPYSGRARTIGLTGAPGAGKSTLVDQLAKFYRKTENPHFPKRARSGEPASEAEKPHSSQKAGLSGPPDELSRRLDQRYTVGIIAVDPTSPYTGGAILGDRIRMQEHFADPGIYIRSMATRGSLGGLARTTADVAMVMDASGRDLVMIETVGVGQDEVDIVRVADVTVVILVPGMGDDVQTIKAGIMEIADIFVINKSDHEGAERVEREIRALQSLATRADGWTPPIVKTVATEAQGIGELAAAIGEYEEYLSKQGLLLQRRKQNWETRLVEMLRDTLLEKARAAIGEGALLRWAGEVAEGKRDPYSVIEGVATKVTR